MDFNITWVGSTNSPNVFEEVGVEAGYAPTTENKDINLDVTVAYKTTTLRFVVDSLLSGIKVDHALLSWSLNFVSCAVLMCLSLKGTAIAVFERDEFRDIYSLFEKAHGEMVLKKEAVAHIPHANEILMMLTRRGILKEGETHYYVVGHILKNIEFSKV